MRATDLHEVVEWAAESHLAEPAEVALLEVETAPKAVMAAWMVCHQAVVSTVEAMTHQLVTTMAGAEVQRTIYPEFIDSPPPTHSHPFIASGWADISAPVVPTIITTASAEDSWADGMIHEIQKHCWTSVLEGRAGVI